MTIIRGNAHDDLESRVMMRVKYVYLMRKFGSSFVLESALILAALLISQFWVSFDKIFANAGAVAMTLSVKSYFYYMVASIANTELVVQTMMSVAFLSVALFFGGFLKVKNVFRFVKPAMRLVGIKVAS